jgi:hypothetical protein
MKSFFISCLLRYAGLLALAVLLTTCGASSSEVAKLPDPNAAVPTTGPQRFISVSLARRSIPTRRIPQPPA